MPAPQVRDLPANIYDALVREAKAQHRSIAQQTTYILEQHFLVEAQEEPADAKRHHPAPTPGWMLGDGTPEERAARAERKRRVFERIASDPRPAIEQSADEIVRLVNEGREERTRAIFEALGHDWLLEEQ